MASGARAGPDPVITGKAESWLESPGGMTTAGLIQAKSENFSETSRANAKSKLVSSSAD